MTTPTTTSVSVAHGMAVIHDDHRSVEVDLLDEPTLPDGLWHIAATDADDVAAETGRPWRTLCGQLRPPARESSVLCANPDDCVVCAEMYARWLLS